MKAQELMLEQWFKREDYKMGEVSQFICNNLLSIYKNPIVCSAILYCAIGKVLIKRGKEYTCRSAGGYLWEYE